MQTADILLVDTQVAPDAGFDLSPELDQKLFSWAEKTYSEVSSKPAEMSLRLVGNEEIKELNKQYRNKDKVTNVLSFPFAADSFTEQWDLGVPILGDVIVCWPVILEEAQQQNKTTENHLAHMVIHGVLHLCGYDHQEDVEAEKMEQLEKQLLTTFGIKNPYE